MTKPKVKKRIIIAKNASMKVNGVNIEKKEKWQSRNWELQSQRKKIF